MQVYSNYKLLDHDGTVIAMGTQSEMFSFVKHHVPDGCYRIVGPDIKLHCLRKEGIVEPDPDGVCLEATTKTMSVAELLERSTAQPCDEVTPDNDKAQPSGGTKMRTRKRGPNVISQISVTYCDGSYLGSVELNADGHPWACVARDANPIEVLASLIVHISKTKTLAELDPE